MWTAEKRKVAMRKTALRRCVLAAALAGGTLLAGPCGVTSLQLQDFITSTLIRTSVSTVSTILENAILQAADTP